MAENTKIKIRATQLWRTRCPLCKKVFTCEKREDAIQKAEDCLALGVLEGDVFQVGEDVMTTDWDSPGFSRTRPMRIIQRYYTLYRQRDKKRKVHIEQYVLIKISDVSNPKAQQYIMGPKDMSRPHTG